MGTQKIHSGSRLKKFLSIFVALMLIAAISYMGIRTYQASFAASGPSIYVNPSSGTLTAGATISVTVRENSGANPVNSVQASLNYDSNALQYSSIVEGGAFPVVAATSTSTPGVIRIGRANADSTLTGDQPVATINFKVLGGANNEGTITVDKAYSLLVRSTDNKDILESVGNGNYSFTGSALPAQQASAVTPPPAAPPSPDGRPILYMSPSTGSLGAGGTVSVAVRLNSYNSAVTTVQAVVQYPADKLQYASVSEGGVYSTQQRTKEAAGTVDIIRGIAGGSDGKTGDNAVVTINFKVLGSSGTAGLGFIAGSAAYDASGTGTNVLNVASSAGATYSLGAAGTGTIAASPAAQSGQISGTRIITSASQALTITSGSKGKAVITTSGNDAVTEVNGEVSLAPAVTMAADGVSGVSKVEYYLDEKLISTQDKTPFAYAFNTNKLRNGSYTMVVKTYFTNGTVDTKTDTILVRNKVTFGYVMRHYVPSALLLIAILVVCAFLIWKLVIPRFGHKQVHAGIAEPDHDVLYSAANPTSTRPVMADPVVIAPNTSQEPAQADPFAPTLQIDRAPQTTPSLVPQPTVNQPAQPPAAPAQSVVISPTVQPTVPPPADKPL